MKTKKMAVRKFRVQLTHIFLPYVSPSSHPVTSPPRPFHWPPSTHPTGNFEESIFSQAEIISLIVVSVRRLHPFSFPSCHPPTSSFYSSSCSPATSRFFRFPLTSDDSNPPISNISYTTFRSNRATVIHRKMSPPFDVIYGNPRPRLLIFRA